VVNTEKRRRMKSQVSPVFGTLAHVVEPREMLQPNWPSDYRNGQTPGSERRGVLRNPPQSSVSPQQHE
jgi:hypothetical protein